MFGPRSALRAIGAAVAVAALTLGVAATAFAAPPAPTLGLSELRSALAASPDHHLSGYLRTVVEGSDITTIPLTVLSVPKTGTADDSLIMFEATGTLIAKYGGIVAGMSGSPVYVNDGGTNKLIGALSYGDYFTLGGTGLATPIEAMGKLETSYPTSVIPLTTSLITANGVINKVIVAPNPQDYAGAAAAGAFVAKPLASVFIGGLNPNSSGYAALKKDLSARGVNVVALDAPLASGVDDGAPFSTEMTAGASLAALVTRGDLWVGGIGTVTYTASDSVLAFGHPSYWAGATSMYMANAWIQGVWPSSYFPYKMGEPGAVRGTITQDRNAGILGKMDRFPAETTITARAINTDTGAETTSAVYIPRALISKGFADYSLVGMSAYVAGSKLFDQRAQPGSAYTTLTVNVSDGSHVYHISVRNHTDSTTDIPSATANDVYNAIAKLQSVLAWGTENLDVLSVDLTGSYSAQRAGAQIVGVEAPSGIRVGANRVNIKAIVYGEADTQTVDATLTVPAGTGLSGALLASAVSNSNMDSMMMISTGSGMQLTVDSFGNPSTPKRKSIAQIAGELNDTAPNSAMTLTYMPGIGAGDLSDGGPLPSTKAITITVNSLWPLAGQATANVASINAIAMPSTVNYGGFTDIAGTIDGATADTVVSLYAKPAGSFAESLVATQLASSFEGALGFDFPIEEVLTNTTYRVHIDGTSSTTGADASVAVNVRAYAILGSSATRIKPGKTVKLTATVFPASSAGGTVVFEQAVGRSWRKIATKTLASSGSFARATFTWKPAKGTQKVRVRYLGGPYNIGATTGTRTITVK